MSAKVSIIIPHFNGEAILKTCLSSLGQTRYDDYDIVLVDNGSTDDSLKMVRTRFPHVRILESATNLGYAGGCNLGIRATASPLVVIMNNDTEVDPDWLGLLVQRLESEERIAAVQPKIRSVFHHQQFDYAGAAGGEIDLFGYPFARGRLFDATETDAGQYDEPGPIFWATGACSILRRSALKRVGLLAESFFAHMEEIDLSWRLQIAGFQIYTEPRAVIYHQSGGTLAQGSVMKMGLNHRNSLLMILRNYEWTTLLWLFPLRLLLELVTLGAALAQGQFKRFRAVLFGFSGLFTHWRAISEGRRQNARTRQLRDHVLMRRMYRGSAALAYFLFKSRTCEDIFTLDSSNRHSKL